MSSPARLEARALSKTFGSNHALRGVDLTVAPGEIHAVVGQNGSGKSTLVKVLAGYHAPDDGGSVHVDGHRLHLPVRPGESRRYGVSVVHQDLGLVGDYSVVENMRIGSFGVRRITRSIRWRAERELARAALAELGSLIDPGARVDELSAAERATVAIARALQHHEPSRGLIMFDEATRALPTDSLDRFHELARGISRSGGSILLVTHRLEEVLAHADRVTVLRDGAVVAGGLETGALSERELVRLMLGYELEPESPRARIAGIHAFERAGNGSQARPDGAAAATLRSVSGALIRDASFTVARGEIVGVTGLAGSGFEELPYLIGAARRARGGTLDTGGGPLELTRASTRDLLAAGVSLVPERRDRDGLAMEMSLVENVTLPRVEARGSRVRIGTRWQLEEAEWVVRELGVRPADSAITVSHLSGGNQQKVLLGKWLCGEPRLLVLHEPTQGVDVGARRDLVRAIAAAAERGCGVVLAGMDASELAVACDRVLVMRAGRVAEELAGDLSFERIVDAVYGDERVVAGER